MSVAAPRPMKNDRDKWNNDPGIDVGELTHRRAEPEDPITKFREDVIHLKEDRFQEPDQQEEEENAGEGRLARQALK